MEQSKGKDFAVPAILYFTDDGTLSVNITIHDEYDSPLVKMLQNKTVDEGKSVIGIYAKNTFVKSFVMLSGMFNFADKTTYVSPEETYQRAMQLMARALALNGCCGYCARQNENCIELAGQESNTDICEQQIIKYFYEKAKENCTSH